MLKAKDSELEELDVDTFLGGFVSYTLYLIIWPNAL